MLPLLFTLNIDALLAFLNKPETVFYEIYLNLVYQSADITLTGW